MRIWIKINTCKLLPVLFLLVLFTLGCGLLGEEEKVRPAPQRQSKKVEKQSMPAVFQRMEDAALDLYHLPGGDWSQAMQGLNKLKSLWQQGGAGVGPGKSTGGATDGCKDAFGGVGGGDKEPKPI